MSTHRNSLIIALCAMALMAFVPATFAAEASSQIKRLEKKFQAADKDGDGKLTRAEAEAGMPRVAKNFDRIDKTGKGYITFDELKAMVEGAKANR